MKTFHREIRRQRQQVRSESIALRRRLSATDRATRRRVGSPLGLALGFGGGVLLGMLRPDRLLVTGRLWAGLIGAVLQGVRTAFFQSPNNG